MIEFFKTPTDYDRLCRVPIREQIAYPIREDPKNDENYKWVKVNRKEDIIISIRILPGEAATEIIRAFHSIKTFQDTDEIYAYKEGYYASAEAAIAITAQNMIPVDMMRNFYVEEILGYIRRATYISREMFNNTLNKVNIENGILNIDGLTLEPHTPDFYSLGKLPVKFDPDAKCPEIEKFLGEVLTPDDIELFYEIVGYCLYKGYPIQKAIMFYGYGSNGKSTALNIIAALLGENVSSHSLQELCYQQFTLVHLYGKLANISADIPRDKITRSGTFKMLTGGDLVFANDKFKKGFFFRNQAKMLFSCNELPAIDDDSDAWFRRWIIITFPYTFEGMHDKKNILRNLTTSDELAGLLQKAIAALHGLMERGHFKHDKSTEELRAEYKMKSDITGAFVANCIVKEASAITPKKIVYTDVYLNFCVAHKAPPKNDNVFAQEMKKAGATNGRHVLRDFGEKQVTTYDGVRVREGCYFLNGMVKSDYSQKTIDNGLVAGLTPKIDDSPENPASRDQGCRVCRACTPFKYIAEQEVIRIPGPIDEKEEKDTKLGTLIGKKTLQPLQVPGFSTIVANNEEHLIGTMKSQREILYHLLDFVKEYEKEFGTAKLQEIIEKSIRKGISESQVIHGLALLAKDGVVYEPRPNHFKVV